jgi:hypothetical protein
MSLRRMLPRNTNPVPRVFSCPYQKLVHCHGHAAACSDTTDLCTILLSRVMESGGREGVWTFRDAASRRTSALPTSMGG